MCGFARGYVMEVSFVVPADGQCFTELGFTLTHG
jgi:hypothetical protein